MGIRGGAIFGPYAGGPFPRSTIEPGPPLGRDDPHHVRQILSAGTTALLNAKKPELGGTPDRPLSETSAYAGTCCDLSETPIADTMLSHLVAHDPENRQLARRPRRRQRDWEGCGSSKAAPAFDALWMPASVLRPPWRKHALTFPGLAWTNHSSRTPSFNGFR